MKKFILVFLAIGLVLTLGSIAMAGTGAPGTGIGHTSHDLSGAINHIGLGTGGGNLWGDATEQAAAASPNKNRICIYCHAPHHTMIPDSTYTYAPLWNHGVTLNAFTMYTNGTDNPLITDLSHHSDAMDLAMAPGSVSLLCLSCHDGSIATNEYGYAPSQSIGAATKLIVGRALIGNAGELSNHHPIGFDYAAVQANDTEIFAPNTALLNQATSPYGVQVGGPAFISDLLWNGQMECTTCHDVHNTKNGGTKFTWIDDMNSRLCLSCHNKNGGESLD
jgi:predicted CXXCH cytochrome family protein